MTWIVVCCDQHGIRKWTATGFAGAAGLAVAVLVAVVAAAAAVTVVAVVAEVAASGVNETFTVES